MYSIAHYNSRLGPCPSASLCSGKAWPSLARDVPNISKSQKPLFGLAPNLPSTPPTYKKGKRKKEIPFKNEQITITPLIIWLDELWFFFFFLEKKWACWSDLIYFILFYGPTRTCKEKKEKPLSPLRCLSDCLYLCLSFLLTHFI